MKQDTSKGDHATMDDQPGAPLYRLFALMPGDQLGQFQMSVLTQDQNLTRIMQHCWQLNVSARQHRTGMLYVVHPARDHPDRVPDISEQNTTRLDPRWSR